MTLSMEDESRLVSRSQDSDKEAFSELVRRHRKGTINVVYRMCGNASLAEDAAQTAFIRAWQHIPSYQPRSSFRSWLYRIAVNAALDMLRHEKPVENIDELPIVAVAEKVEDCLEKQEKIQRVRQAVLSLPEASRVILILREYEGLSYQEMANALDISIGTVMSRLNYARKRLLEQLSPYLEEI
jgi:RNA polymerase sigma-70 factor (ECF subfamily)